MRFLYVAPRFHPNQYPIIEGLIQKGHEVMFCVSRVGSTEKHDGVTVKVMEPSMLSKCICRFFSRKGENYAETQMIFWFQPKGEEVRRCVKEYEPDVVILRDRNLLSLSFANACRWKKKIKVLLYNQNPVFVRPVRGVKGLIRFMWFLLFPAKRISVCKHASYPFGEIFPKEKHAYFMPHVPRQMPPEDRGYLKNGMVNIFDCGKYRPYKNHTLLVEAMAILIKRGHKNFHVTILGQTDNDEEKRYYTDLQEKVSRLGLKDYFDLRTSVPYDEVPEYYLNNDVFVLASKREQATVSILDSMSYGLATISTSANGTADYIRPGETGYVFKTNDAQDLSEKIENYLKEPELVAVHGREAMREVKNDFGFESYYGKLMKIIEDL